MTNRNSFANFVFVYHPLSQIKRNMKLVQGFLSSKLTISWNERGNGKYKTCFSNIFQSTPFIYKCIYIVLYTEILIDIMLFKSILFSNAHRTELITKG